MCTPAQGVEGPSQHTHTFSSGPCVPRERQVFGGLLYPRPFWEVGDSCSYKARDSWVAGDSWMGLASPCLPGCPGTPRPDSRQLAALPAA